MAAPALLAARLAGATPVVSCEVPLAPLGDEGPDGLAASLVVGSFSEGGLAFAVTGEGQARLVASDPSALAAWPWADGEAEAPEGPALAIPSTVSHGTSSYAVSSVGPRALDGCGAAAVRVPASVSSADPAALASPALQRVEVDPESPHLASFDGALYGAGLSCLLSIPGGRQGAVRIPDSAEGVDPSAFSHRAGAGILLADAGGAALASWDELLQGAPDDEMLPLPDGTAAIVIDDSASAGRPAADELLAEEAPSASQGGGAALDVAPSATLARSSAARDASVIRFFGGDGKLEIVGGRFTTDGSGEQVWHDWVDWGTWQSFTLEAHIPYAKRGYNVPGFIHYEVNCDTLGPYFQTMESGQQRAVGSGTWRFSVDAQKPGYTFKGWHIGSPTGTVPHDGNNEHGSFFTPQGGTDYYASFGTPYSATVKGAGGTFQKYKALSTGYQLVESGLGEVQASWSAASAIYGDGAFDYNDGTDVGWRLRPVRPGYGFGGYEERTPEGAVSTVPGSTGVHRTVPGATYTAKWNRITYSISYDANGGTLSGQRTSYTVEDADFTLAVPTRQGYTFQGWEVAGAQGTGIGGSGASTVVRKGTYGNLQAKAKWGAPYTATVSGGGGTLDRYRATASGLELDQAGLPTLEMKWDAASAIYAAAGDRCIDWNRASGEGWRMKAERPGYRFDGFACRKPDGTTELIHGGSGVRSTVPGAVYTATWSVATYSIKYDTTGGELGGGPTSYTIEDADFALPTPTRRGYTFSRWKVTGAQGVGVTSSGASTTVRHGTYGDLTATAEWGAPYTATASAGAGTFQKYKALSTGYELVESELGEVQATWSGASAIYGDGAFDYNDGTGTGWRLRPVRAGYGFAGYEERAADGSVRVVPGSSGVERTVPGAVYTALWEPVSYAIAYDAAGGELAGGARASYTVEDATFELPVPKRYGYQFDGWEVAGAQGAGVETVALDDGSKATRVKAGTYGDLSCTAKWTLRYDLDVPVADPGSVTFEADSLTGQVRVKPGTSATGEVRSFMAEPVALDVLACEGLDASGDVPDSGGAPELEAIFGPGSASKVRFTATLGQGDGAMTARLSPGDQPASLAMLSIPAAASAADPGRLPVTYGLELDADLAIPPVRDAAPVARLTYTVSLPGPDA